MKILKKLRSRSGFSITELLVVLAIMSLVGTAIGVGMATGASALTTITTSSNASVLCNTIATEICDELRFATDIDASGEFTSARYGADVSIGSDGEGHVLIGGLEILSKKTYTNLSAEVDVVFDGDSFAVEIDVSKDGKVWAETDFSIAPLN